MVDDAGHLFSVSQHHEVRGAAGDELVKAVLGVILGVDGGSVAADEGLNGLDHVAGETGCRRWRLCLILA